MRAPDGDVVWLVRAAGCWVEVEEPNRCGSEPFVKRYLYDALKASEAAAHAEVARLRMMLRVAAGEHGNRREMNCGACGREVTVFGTPDEDLSQYVSMTCSSCAARQHDRMSGVIRPEDDRAQEINAVIDGIVDRHLPLGPGEADFGTDKAGRAAVVRPEVDQETWAYVYKGVVRSPTDNSTTGLVRGWSGADGGRDG